MSSSWWSIAGGILNPWIVVGYVWWVGLHWTVIGLGVVYIAALLIAVGRTWENARRGK